MTYSHGVVMVVNPLCVVNCLYNCGRQSSTSNIWLSKTNLLDKLLDYSFVIIMTSCDVSWRQLLVLL